ncbi:MAG: lipopolysaccharide kinase InaA family protein [Planctomycetota bacterium]
MNYRRLKKTLRTGETCLQIRERGYVAAFDSDFCSGAEPRDLIERVDAMMDAGQILKDGDTCYVSRLTWNDRDVVVKRYNHLGLVHSLRYTIKKSRASKGWLNAHYLEAIQVPTPRCLAYIEERRGLLLWQSYLVTEYVEGRMLWRFLRDDDVTERQRLDGIRQVVQMLGRLWQHHITHGDLKHTNILIAEKGPVLTDLDGMIVHRWEPLYRNKRAKDEKRFLRKTDVSPELRNHCQELILGASDPSRQLVDDFDTMRIDDWAILVRKDFPERDLRDLLSIADSPGQGKSEFAAVPSSRFARVFRCGISSGANGPEFYLKKYLCRSALDFVKHLFRPSRARRAFDASLMLARNGFDAPAVVALFERRVGPFCSDNSLLTEEVENAGSMVEILTDLCTASDADTLVRKRDLIRAFAEMLGRMHAKGIFHGDLRLGNVLVTQEGRKWRFFLIDNERTRKFHSLPSRLRLKNLVQVNMFIHGISNTDRLRFFGAYLSENPSIQRRYVRWAKKIIVGTNKRLSRKNWFDN